MPLLNEHVLDSVNPMKTVLAVLWPAGDVV